MFRKIGLELNGRNVGDTSQLYPYRSHLESLLNFCKEVQETNLLCERCTKDTTGHMGVTAVGGNNAGLNARASTFARSTVVELVGHPHLDVCHQESLIPPKINLQTKLIQSTNNFVCKSAAPGQGVQQKTLQVNYPERQSHYSNQEAHKHCSWRDHGSSREPKYGASLFARPNEAPVDSHEPNVYQLRQRLY